LYLERSIFSHPLFLVLVLFLSSVNPSTAAALDSNLGSQISTEEFLNSPFAQFFKQGEYAQALEILDVLSNQYSEDPLVGRYRAIVLERMGRSEEAIQILKGLLKENPDQVAVRYFLAQTYQRMGRRDDAFTEWEFVVRNNPDTEYGKWSRYAMAASEISAVQPAQLKRFYVLGQTGASYDSNPLLEPNDKRLISANDGKQAIRLNLDLGLGYRAVATPHSRVNLLYVGRQSRHTHDFEEADFHSQEISVDAKRRVDFLGRDMVLSLSYLAQVGFLHYNLFSTSNEFTMGSDITWNSRLRTYVYNRFTVSNYGDDGADVTLSSRDGIYEEPGFTQYLYFSNYRKYLYVSQEYDIDDTRGNNYDRRGMSSRLGFHSDLPFIENADLDLSTGFYLAQYPHFKSLSSLDPERRRDKQWDVYMAYTHRFSQRIATRFSYRFVKANNNSGFYDYDRHIAGAELLFAQDF
jgi:tetratricopeptide (TPR) repeat protein